MGRGIGFSWPSPIGRVAEGRRRGDPHHHHPRQRRRESDPDRRPERHRPRLFGALEHQEPASSICSRSPIPKRPSARSPRARCAPRSRGSASTTRSAPGARDIEQTGRADHAAIARRLRRRRRRSQGIAINQSAPPRGGQRGLPRSLGGAAARAERDEQRPRLCAAADRPRPGRGGRVREGLCRISRRPRSHPAAHVLRDDGADPRPGRHDHRRGAGRHALSAAARDPAPPSRRPSRSRSRRERRRDERDAQQPDRARRRRDPAADPRRAAPSRSCRRPSRR